MRLRGVFFVGGSTVECVLRGKMVLSPRGMLGGKVLRGIWGIFEDGIVVAEVLRGKIVLSPRGMFGGNVLRGNLGIFMDGIAVEGVGYEL